MKKTIVTVALCAFTFLGFNAVAQQGEWAGLVKYKIEWKGNVPQGASQETSVKVYKNMSGSGTSIANAANNTIVQMFDFSQMPPEISEVQGKWFVKVKVKDEDLKQISYKYTGVTKEIAGVKCEQVIATAKNPETGEESSDTLFATKEIGPKIDLTTYPGLDAFPMEYRVDYSDELSATLTASELLKGKVKDVDLMIESGYEEVSQEDMQDMIKTVQDYIKKMYGGEASDDDM